MKTLKNILSALLIIFITLVIFFGLLEGIFRLTNGVPNPLADVTQKRSDTLFTPNDVIHNRSSADGEFDTTIHINSLGYRGPEFSPVKPNSRLRIFAVGDSFTAGVGANDDQTMPAVMEKLLRTQGRDVEVINAGIGHASPVQYYDHLYRLHLKYKPDLVVLFFDLTDLWDDWHWERHMVLGKDGHIDRFDLSYRDGKRDWWATLVQHSAFCKWFDAKGVRAFKKMQLLGFKRYVSLKKDGTRAKAEIINSYNKIPDEDIMELDGLLFLRGRDHSRLILKNWTRTTKYLTKIRDLLAEQHIPLIIVMYPHGIYVDGDQWNEGRKTWGFEQGRKYTDYYPFELMADYTQKNQIPFINTLPGFLFGPKQTYFYNWDGHMTPAGYKMVADQVVADPLFLSIVNNLKAGNANGTL
ncbi:MAG: hypothetical protein HQL26_01220 [Candidatus Omnitrophica bacterium]|nr:hypothetical protein [Candidatus Omnitrophota bacterium]